MSLRSDLDAAFDTSDVFTLTVPRGPDVGSVPLAFTRYGGRQEERNIVEVVILTGPVRQGDPYIDSDDVDTEERVEQALEVIYGVEGAFPEELPIQPVHNWVVGKDGRAMVGALIRVLGS